MVEDMEVDDDPGPGVHVDGIFIPAPPPPALTFDNDGPRLLITKITNVDFKSYGGTTVLGPFHKNFTSIVGPNGSGKSNVIDSMLFVFGYRAQKIRSKKVSVLIHNSELFPNCSFCKVSVHFCEILDNTNDPDEYEVVENSAFVVSRTAHKDNSSYYEINNIRKTYKEVAAFLRKKGIDLDNNRFLILQGEVEQIAMMKRKGTVEGDTGLLEFLEDIIGSSRLKEPIDILTARVADLDVLKSQKHSRVEMMKSERDSITGAKDEAINYLEDENALTRKLNHEDQLKLYHEKKNKVAFELEKEKFEDSCKELLEKLDQAVKAKKETEQECQEILSKLEECKKLHKVTREKCEDGEKRKVKLVEDLTNLNKKRKAAKAQANADAEKCSKLELVPETNQEKIEECLVLKKRLEKEIEENQKTFDSATQSLSSETKDYQDQKKILQEKLIHLKGDANDKEVKYNVLKSEMDIEESKEQKEKCRLEQLQDNLRTCTATIDEKSKIIQECQGNVQLEKRISGVEKELSEVTTEYDKCGAKVRTLRANFEESRSLQMANKSKNKVYDALIRQRNCDAIPGIFGRLGDLGAIDAKYDVAISNAGGSSLDTMIVDTVETAKTCVEFLRRNDIGRGMFLALDKTLKWRNQCDEYNRYPENVPRLFDLVTVSDEKFRTAFYHYLRDTLVADNLPQAQRIAYGAQRHRVVTLDGDIIEASGIMTGGGRDKLRGKMGSQILIDNRSSEKSLASLEKTLQQEEEEMRRCLCRKNELETHLVSLTKSASEASKKLERACMELQNLKKEKETLEPTIVKQREILKKCAPDKAKINSLKAKGAILEKEYVAACEKAESQEAKVEELNKKINDVKGRKIIQVIKSYLFWLKYMVVEPLNYVISFYM